MQAKTKAQATAAFFFHKVDADTKVGRILKFPLSAGNPRPQYSECEFTDIVTGETVKFNPSKLENNEFGETFYEVDHFICKPDYLDVQPVALVKTSINGADFYVECPVKRITDDGAQLTVTGLVGEQTVDAASCYSEC